MLVCGLEDNNANKPSTNNISIAYDNNAVVIIFINILILLVLFVNEIHYNLHHYILLLSAALCNHQSKCNEGVVGNAFVSIFGI